MSSYDQGRGSAIRQEAILILRDRNSPCCCHVCRARGHICKKILSCTYAQWPTCRVSVCVWGGGSHAGARPKINAAGCRAQQHTRARRAAGIVSTRQQRLQSARIVDIRLNDIYDWSVFTVQHASHYGAGSRGQRGYLPLVNSPYERGNKSSRSQVIVRQTDSSVGICRHLEISASEESPLQWVVFRSALTPRRLEGRKS